MRVVSIRERGPGPIVGDVQVEALVVGPLALRVAIGLAARAGAGLAVLAAAGLVLVLRVVLLVLLTEPLRLLDERSLVVLIQEPGTDRRTDRRRHRSMFALHAEGGRIDFRPFKHLCISDIASGGIAFALWLWSSS